MAADPCRHIVLGCVHKQQMCGLQWRRGQLNCVEPWQTIQSIMDPDSSDAYCIEFVCIL